MSQKQLKHQQSKLNQDFIAAFRQGQTAAARKALAQGANPPHETVHWHILHVHPYLDLRTYAELWKLYFDMRGELNDAPEVEQLSYLTRHGVDGQAHVARQAIMAHTGAATLRAVGGALLVDACASGDPASVQLVLAAGVDPHYVDAHGVTVLQHAAQAAHPEVFKLLCQAGLDPQQSKTLDGKSLLMLAAAVVTHKIPKWEDGDEVSSRYLLRRQCQQKNAAEALTYLLALGLKPRKAQHPMTSVLARSQVTTPLQAAMRAHNPYAVHALLQAGAKLSDPQQREFETWFAQHITTSFEAATLDALTILRLLQQARSKPLGSKKLKYSGSALHQAIHALAAQRWTAAALAPFALARRAVLQQDLNRALQLEAIDPSMLTTLDGDGATPFMLALRCRLPGVLDQLLDAGVLPRAQYPALPVGLVRMASMLDVAYDDGKALTRRKPHALGEGWNGLIAAAMIVAADHSDQAKAGQALWCTALAFRHAHQCETAGMARDLEQRQRAVLLRTVKRLAARQSWDQQWQLFAPLLAEPLIVAGLQRLTAARS